MYVYSSPLRPLDSEQHSFPSGRVAAVSVLPPWERREPLRVYTALDSWLSPRPWSPSLYWFLRGTDLKKSKLCQINWGINLSDFSIINKWVPLELECTIERITIETWIFFLHLYQSRWEFTTAPPGQGNIYRMKCGWNAINVYTILAHNLIRTLYSLHSLLVHSLHQIVNYM